MGAGIWWKAENGIGTTTYHLLDLACYWSDIDEPRPVPLESSAEAISGDVSSVRLSMRVETAFRAETIVDVDLVRDLHNFCGSAQRGNKFVLSSDSAKAYAGVTVADASVGDTVIAADDHWVLEVIGTGGTKLAAGDWLVIRTPSPDYRWEIVTVVSHVGSAIACSPLKNGFPAGSLVRFEGFYPICRLPLAARSQQLMKTSHRILWDLELPIVECLDWEEVDDPGGLDEAVVGGLFHGGG